ncbi:protein YIF1B-B-like isoform X2 [Lineus longissimus]|uniref:protein YIF1B-B-like isoform X2 n=1 Tax=Lineus longissimus TaxID=88925 RepID=UPI00315CC25F
MDSPSGFRNPSNTQQKRQRPAKSRSKNPQLFDDTSSQQPMNPQGPYGPTPGMTDIESSISEVNFEDLPPVDASYAQSPYFTSSSGMPEHGMPHPEMMPGPGYDQGQGMPPYGQQGQQPYIPGQQMFNDPMAGMAMQYGTNLAGKGSEIVQEKFEKYMSKSKLKYYFAVDTAYVGKKLGLLLFPYTHQDWAIHYNQDEPVAPRLEINAPDLYIPVMAFVTYVLVAGVVLGTQNRFTPEQLGIQASTALVWTIIEILAVLMTLYVMSVATDLKYLDLLAYSGYKYVGMIFTLLAGLIFKTGGYYLVLLWCSAAIAFFLMRTLRVKIQPHGDEDGYQRGGKRRMYMMLMIAGTQPLLMWWLTRYIMFK